MSRDIIIQELDQNSCIESAIEFAKEKNIPYDNSFIGSIKSLESSNIIKVEMQKITKQIITDNGKEVLQNGTEEYRLFNAIDDNGTLKSELEVCKLTLC